MSPILGAIPGCGQASQGLMKPNLGDRYRHRRTAQGSEVLLYTPYQRACHGLGRLGGHWLVLFVDER